MTEAPPRCPGCRKPQTICVCDRIVRLPSRVRILVLQHPQEDDFILGTAPLLASSMSNCQLRVGLSWRSLTHALEVADSPTSDPASEPGPSMESKVATESDEATESKVATAFHVGSGADLPSESVDPSKWAVVYPAKVDIPEEAREAPAWLVDKKGKLLPDSARSAIEGLVVLDGTWSQAKTLWWRNPWLLKLSKMVLTPAEPSIYGKLRKEPSRSHVSTLEAVADALVALDEPETSRAQLRKLMRTMVQRVRDSERQ